MKPYVHQMKYIAEIGYGFGYDCGIEDYKVVAVINSEEYLNVSYVGVYTLGSDSWKTISSIPYKLAKGYNNVRFPVFPGVFLNGALHWLAQSFSGNGLQVLLSFDMKDEIFAEIHQPENLDKFDYKFVGLLGGCLCMLCSVGFEVWVMQHYGVRESWTKLLEMDQLMTVDIPSFHYLRRTVSLRNGEILLEIQLDAGDKMDGGEDTAIIVYDPKWERTRIVKILLKRIENFSPGYILRKLYEIDSYVESLVSVNPGSYTGAMPNKK
ncbi:F-box/kelch-repeat protein At3g06240-like [Papaver somniferum]|uniref:F-box/kelch-repeat protein At3g06240-like n=1 Tax=Papaver somniferum TaxID=3469 RepID=UPI000E6F537D|nr:F-box/kelch-repeat protein At3g06240-like [Papaver somniferum]